MKADSHTKISGYLNFNEQKKTPNRHSRVTKKKHKLREPIFQ